MLNTQDRGGMRRRKIGDALQGLHQLEPHCSWDCPRWHWCIRDRRCGGDWAACAACAARVIVPRGLVPSALVPSALVPSALVPIALVPRVARPTAAGLLLLLRRLLLLRLLLLRLLLLLTLISWIITVTLRCPTRDDAAIVQERASHLGMGKLLPPKQQPPPHFHTKT
jgi:hypothetical protein